MAGYAETAGIDYPICRDVDNQTSSAFAVDSYPDYYIIDRKGNLRVADLSNGDLERTVIALLAEPGSDTPVSKASAVAKKKNKRILVVLGNDSERKPFDELLKSKELRTLARNEFEVVSIARDADQALTQRLGASAYTAGFAVLDASGQLLASMESSAVEASALKTFLETHRIPAIDAEQVWASALEQAQREKKNLLVHLAAPW
ncbi:MAG: hypothetical protein ACI841_000102 [Planctomycetota bacterium]|jgi:hypothetical protein